MQGRTLMTYKVHASHWYYCFGDYFLKTKTHKSEMRVCQRKIRKEGKHRNIIKEMDD